MGRKPNKSPRIDAFIREYLQCSDATEAARRAGYARKSAGSMACTLLKKPVVQDAIRKAQEKLQQRAEISQERVLRELGLLAFSDVTHYTTDAQGNLKLVPGAPEGAQRAVSSVKRKIRTYGEGEKAVTEVDVEIRLWNKPEPLKLAGRHVGVRGCMDRVEVTGPGGGPVRVAVDLSKLSDTQLNLLEEILTVASVKRDGA